jgi:hypothetical protein
MCKVLGAILRDPRSPPTFLVDFTMGTSASKPVPRYPAWSRVETPEEAAAATQVPRSAVVLANPHSGGGLGRVTAERVQRELTVRDKALAW